MTHFWFVSLPYHFGKGPRLVDLRLCLLSFGLECKSWRDRLDNFLAMIFDDRDGCVPLHETPLGIHILTRSQSGA